jgi:hypothetical protein
MILFVISNAREIARPYDFPGTGAFFWKEFARKVGPQTNTIGSTRPICIPIDPFGWIAGDPRCLNQPVEYPTILNFEHREEAEVYLRQDLPSTFKVDGLELPLFVDDDLIGGQIKAFFSLSNKDVITQYFQVDSTFPGPRMIFLRPKKTFDLALLVNVKIEFPFGVRYYSPVAIPKAVAAVLVVFRGSE